MLFLGVRKGESPIETTIERIAFARKEQLAARLAGNDVLEETWSRAIDRLLTIYMNEKDTLNASS